MKLAISFSSILFVASVSVNAADDLPKKFDFGRYQAILDHSPFAVATAVVAPAATPAPCKDLYIANAARSPDGDMVTLMSTSDKDFKKYITSKQPVDGYAIGNIEWSDRVGETKVTISKDGQFCTLTFNQSLISQPLPNKPPVPAPGFVQPPQPGLVRPPQPGMPAATPHIRATIQRNPQSQAQPMRSPSQENE